MNEAIERTYRFTMLSDAVIDDERIGLHELAVYTALCRYTGKERTAFPGMRTLAQKARIAYSTCQAAVRRLEELGYLQIEHRERNDGKPGYTSNLYTVIDTVGGAPHAGAGVHRVPVQGAPPHGDEVDSVKKIQKEEEEERAPASTQERAQARETATPSTATAEVISTLRTSGVLTTLKAETVADIETFAAAYGTEALADVVADYLAEKPVEKIRKFVNVDLRERIADATDDYERQRQETEERKLVIAETARRLAEEEEERRNRKPIPTSPCPICGKPEQMYGFPCFLCQVSNDMSIRAQAREIKTAAERLTA